MSEEFVILMEESVADHFSEIWAYNVSADALFVYGKCLHSELHPIETCGFPDKVSREVVGAL